MKKDEMVAKKPYVEPELSKISFFVKDIICTSGTKSELPRIPA